MIPGYELASNTPMKNLRAYINLTSFAAAIKATPTNNHPNQLIISLPSSNLSHPNDPLDSELTGHDSPSHLHRG